MNRMVDPESLEWAQWTLLFTMGGFIGNVIFSLADHAGNDFFFDVEWVPVVATAVAIGFLCVPPADAGFAILYRPSCGDLGL